MHASACLCQSVCVSVCLSLLVCLSSCPSTTYSPMNMWSVTHKMQTAIACAGRTDGNTYTSFPGPSWTTNCLWPDTATSELVCTTITPSDLPLPNALMRQSRKWVEPKNLSTLILVGIVCRRTPLQKCPRISPRHCWPTCDSSINNTRWFGPSNNRLLAWCVNLSQSRCLLCLHVVRRISSRVCEIDILPPLVIPPTVLDHTADNGRPWAAQMFGRMMISRWWSITGHLRFTKPLSQQVFPLECSCATYRSTIPDSWLANSCVVLYSMPAPASRSAPQTRATCPVISALTFTCLQKSTLMTSAFQTLRRTATGQARSARASMPSLVTKIFRISFTDGKGPSFGATASVCLERRLVDSRPAFFYFAQEPILYCQKRVLPTMGKFQTSVWLPRPSSRVDLSPLWLIACRGLAHARNCGATADSILALHRHHIRPHTTLHSEDALHTRSNQLHSCGFPTWSKIPNNLSFGTVYSQGCTSQACLHRELSCSRVFYDTRSAKDAFHVRDSMRQPGAFSRAWPRRWLSHTTNGSTPFVQVFPISQDHLILRQSTAFGDS